MQVKNVKQCKLLRKNTSYYEKMQVFQLGGLK